ELAVRQAVGDLDQEVGVLRLDCGLEGDPCEEVAEELELAFFVGIRSPDGDSLENFLGRRTLLTLGFEETIAPNLVASHDPCADLFECDDVRDGDPSTLIRAKGPRVEIV